MADYPPLLRLPSILSVLKEFLPTYFNGMSSSFSTFLDESWSAIKRLDPLGLFDAVVRFVTRLPYQSIIAIVNTLGRVLVANGSFYRRFVIKGDDVIRFMVKANTETFTQSAQLGSSDLFDLFLGFLATLGWSIATRSTIVHKVLKLLKVNSYQDLFTVFKSSALKQLWLTVARTALIWFALGFTLVALLVIGAFFHQWFESFALAQDSKRMWRKKGAVHRVNAHRGPDS